MGYAFVADVSLLANGIGAAIVVNLSLLENGIDTAFIAHLSVLAWIWCIFCNDPLSAGK